MSFIPVLLTLPLPVLAALLYNRVKKKPEESFHLLSLNSTDVKIAFQLFGFGFVSILALVISRALNADSGTIGILAGISVTVSLTVALSILNVAARPPGAFHDYLPGRRR